MGDWTGTLITSLDAGAKLRGIDADMLRDIADALTGSWTTWVPTLTNLTQGNGTVTAVYRRLGKTLDYSFKFKLGSSSAVGTGPKFTLPGTPASRYAAIEDELGTGTLLDSGTADRGATVFVSTPATTVEILSYSTTGVVTTITATVPWTWTTNDSLAVHGTIELA